MTDLSAPASLDFLPPGIAGKPLYQFLGPLIDHALRPGDGTATVEVDPLVSALMLDYADAEAVNAYVNLLVLPIVGTRRSMDYAFRLLDINPALVEWWQPALRSHYDTVAPTGPSDRSFHFTVTFPDGTLPKGPFSYADLIKMLLALKNERSKLVSVRMADCADMLTLDNDCILDENPLDALEGFVDPDTGVVICLHESFPQAVDGSLHVSGALQTSYRVDTTHAFTAGLLDFTSLSADAGLDQGTFDIAQVRTSSRTANTRYRMRNFNLATSSFTLPQGRTSQATAAIGGESVQAHARNGRTSDRSQVAAADVAPRVTQTIPARLMTQCVSADMLYAQAAWDDRPYQPSMTNVVFYLSEDYAEGDAVAILRINNIVVDVVTIKAHQSLGQSQAFAYSGDFGSGYFIVSVEFTNDFFDPATGADRNMYMLAFEIDGVKHDINYPMYSNGHWSLYFLFAQQPRTWKEDGMAWVGKQPQNYSRRVTQIVDGWSLGPAHAVFGRPMAYSTSFYGAHGAEAVVFGRPALVAAAAAPPTGSAISSLAQLTAAGRAVQGVGGAMRAASAVPVGRSLGLMVPQAFGLASVPSPLASGVVQVPDQSNSAGGP